MTDTTKPRGGRLPGWTREQAVAVHRLRAGGLSVQKIADALGITHRRVRWILERHPELGLMWSSDHSTG